MRRDLETRGCLAWRRYSRENSFSVHKYLKGSGHEGGAGLVSVVINDRARGNRYNL